MGLAFCDYIYIHLEGDKLTELNYEQTMLSLPPVSNKIFTRTDISSDIRNFSFTFCDSGYIAFYKDKGLFVFLEASGNNFSPLMRRFKTETHSSYDRILFDTIMPESEEQDIIRVFVVDQVNKLFVEKPAACSFTDTRRDNNIYTPTFLNVYEFQILQVRFRWTSFDIPKQLIPKFEHLVEFSLHYPSINQITSYENREPIPNLPRGLRQLVLSVSPQYSVNPTFRGRMTSNTSNTYLLIKRLREEFGDVIIEFIISNGFNGEPVIFARVDLSNKNEACLFYVRVRDKAPLYATLRFPIQMLELHTLHTVYSGNEQNFTDDSEFESNVIFANAGMAAAAIGGGVLSGLGQGLGEFYKAKVQMEMQDKYLKWQANKQFNDYTNQKFLQQSMFDFKASQQGKEMDYGRQQQQRAIDWSREQQQEGFAQQNRYQNTQNQFTKELVEANADSDIRRARNAQQLAGYRTDAAVSGINFVPGRGGLGHPDAPRGASLPPRSASTQTDSPKVYLTRSTGYYTGPLSNYERI